MVIKKTLKEFFNNFESGKDIVSVINSGAVDLIASLHNELYNKVTGGAYYDYMFHWANKCGGWSKDDLLRVRRIKIVSIN